MRSAINRAPLCTRPSRPIAPFSSHVLCLLPPPPSPPLRRRSAAFLISLPTTRAHAPNARVRARRTRPKLAKLAMNASTALHCDRIGAAIPSSPSSLRRCPEAHAVAPSRYSLTHDSINSSVPPGTQLHTRAHARHARTPPHARTRPRAHTHARPCAPTHAHARPSFDARTRSDTDACTHTRVAARCIACPSPPRWPLAPPPHSKCNLRRRLRGVRAVRTALGPARGTTPDARTPRALASQA